MKKKQYKVFNYVFWASIILDIIFLALTIYDQATYLFYYNNIKNIKNIILIMLIVNFIILYRQFKLLYNSGLEIEYNQKAITRIFSFFFIIIVVFLTSKQITLKIESDRVFKFKDTANIILETYNSFQKNKIYDIDEIKANVSIYKSSFNRNYKKDSYITTIGENNYICLNDGLYLVEGFKNNYNVLKNSKCNYDYIYDNIELYVSTYLQEKYNKKVIVNDCIERNDIDLLFNNDNDIVCKFKTEENSIEYNVYVSKKDLKITDDYFIK